MRGLFAGFIAVAAISAAEGQSPQLPARATLDLVFDVRDGIAIPTFKRVALDSEHGREIMAALSKYVVANCPAHDPADLRNALEATSALVPNRREFCLFPAIAAALESRRHLLSSMSPAGATERSYSLEIRLRGGLVFSKGRLFPADKDLKTAVEFLYLGRAATLALERVGATLKQWHNQSSGVNQQTIAPRARAYLSSGIPLADLVAYASTVRCIDDPTCQAAKKTITEAAIQARAAAVAVANELNKPLRSRVVYPTVSLASVRAIFALDQQLLTALRAERSATTIAEAVVGSGPASSTARAMTVTTSAYKQMWQSHPRWADLASRNDLYCAVVVASELADLAPIVEPVTSPVTERRPSAELEEFVRTALDDVLLTANRILSYSLVGLRTP